MWTDDAGDAVTFNDDGSYSFAATATRPGDSGTWAANDGQLVLTDEISRYTAGYYLSGDTLAFLRTYVPDGEVQGLIGKWRASWREQLFDNSAAPGNVEGYDTLQLQSDGTLLHGWSESDAGSGSSMGQWSTDGAELDLTVDGSSEMAALVADGVLAVPVNRRAR